MDEIGITTRRARRVRRLRDRLAPTGMSRLDVGARIVEAVEAERERFNRDLHDILGHSLTVIALKADLARRLLTADPDRAATELAELAELSQEAVGDVRRAVGGSRDLSLDGELAKARVALAAAEIEAVLHGAGAPAPGDLEEVLAWTVREAVTNVLRHSGARRCEIVVTDCSAEVRDDGAGNRADPTNGGSGLLGLAARARAVGAQMRTRELHPGWSVEVFRDRRDRTDP